MWQDRLEADHANLRGATEHAAGQPDGTSRVMRFAIALWRYWGWHDRYEEAAGLLVPVLRRPEAAADPALSAEALYSAACMSCDIDMTMSVQLAEQMDQVASQLCDNRLLAMSRGHLAWVYRELRRARASAAAGTGVGSAGPRTRRRRCYWPTSIVQYAATIIKAPPRPCRSTQKLFACCERSGHAY